MTQRTAQNIQTTSSLYIKYQIAKNNIDTTYCTEHTNNYIKVNKVTNRNK
jgi:hypothetical protein